MLKVRPDDGTDKMVYLPGGAVSRTAFMVDTRVVDPGLLVGFGFSRKDESVSGSLLL